MACVTTLRCLSVWMDAQRTMVAVDLPVAARRPSQCCMHHPRRFSLRPWREASCPRGALPSRPWHGQRDQTAWTCQQAPNAASEQFLRSRLLRRLRSATYKTFVAPVDRADHQGPGCAGTAPMACATALRCLGLWPDTERILGAVDLLSAARWPSQCLVAPLVRTTRCIQKLPLRGSS